MSNQIVEDIEEAVRRVVASQYYFGFSDAVPVGKLVRVKRWEPIDPEGAWYEQEGHYHYLANPLDAPKMLDMLSPQAKRALIGHLADDELRAKIQKALWDYSAASCAKEQPPQPPATTTATEVHE